MSAEDIYRGATRRAHRTLGSYLVQWAWANGVDCVALTRDQYLDFAGIRVMQDSRVAWLKEDLRSIFPFSHSNKFTGRAKWAAIYLSRHPFPNGVFRLKPAPTTKKRIALMNKLGLRAAVAESLDEAKVVEAMARVASGLEDFKSAPWSRP